LLAEFIESHHAELVARTRAKAVPSPGPRTAEIEADYGVPLFLDQLVETLRRSLTTGDAISRSARIHGRVLLRTGFTVAQLVHDYGDVCQAVTELAVEKDAPITAGEFRVLNRCLDDAIAESVTEYTAQREQTIVDEGTRRLGTVVHEIRGRLSTAMMSFYLLKEGRVGISGPTGSILERSLKRMGDLLDRSYAEIRLASGSGELERVLVPELLEHVEVDASIEANTRGVILTFDAGPPGVYVKVDRLLIMSALANLLQNAFKFGRAQGRVSLRTRSTAEHVLFEVEDECGGLPPGRAEELFLPFRQRSPDRTGLGLGLDIARQSVEACGGTIRVTDLPGSGCVFTIELPRQPAPEP
jgi:hypothetical protein